MDRFELLDRAGGEFAKRLRAVKPADHARPTPCTDWTVRDLAHHVVGGNRVATLLLNGGSAQDAIAVRQTDVLGSNWVEAFNGSYRTMYDSFHRKGALEKMVAHPAAAEPIPATQLLGFRLTDLTIHAWDLARAIGADDALNAELVSALWTQLEPLKEGFKNSGVFGGGASGSLPDSAPLQTRLLDLTGRRP